MKYEISTHCKIRWLYQYEIDQAVEELLERVGIEVEAPLDLGDVAVEDAAAERGVLDGNPNRTILLLRKYEGCVNASKMVVTHA